MIGYLKGEIIDQQGGTVIVGVNGVGYAVNVSESPIVGQEVEFFIHTSLKQDSLTLWGFASSEEKDLFEMLLGVSGVGNRTAMNLLAARGYSGVISAISLKDQAGLKAPGIGKRTAERIILELAGKIDDLALSSVSSTSTTNTQKMQDSEVAEEAAAALVQLGYSQRDVEAALSKLNLSQFNTSADIIRAVLQSM